MSAISRLLQQGMTRLPRFWSSTVPAFLTAPLRAVFRAREVVRIIPITQSGRPSRTVCHAVGLLGWRSLGNAVG
eukprot:107996-Pyramimonas_sp.AAC.1